MEQTVKIEGMKCDGCVGIVKEKFAGITGVEAVEVSLAENSATLTTAENLSQDRLQAALADTKFTVTV